MLILICIKGKFAHVKAGKNRTKKLGIKHRIQLANQHGQYYDHGHEQNDIVGHAYWEFYICLLGILCLLNMLITALPRPIYRNLSMNFDRLIAYLSNNNMFEAFSS